MIRAEHLINPNSTSFKISTFSLRANDIIDKIESESLTISSKNVVKLITNWTLILKACPNLERALANRILTESQFYRLSTTRQRVAAIIEQLKEVKTELEVHPSSKFTYKKKEP